jgi:hypothetical protein
MLSISPNLRSQYFHIYDIIILINKGIIMNNKYGKWTIIEDAGRDKKSNKLVLCKCDCGTEKIQALSTLQRGFSTQCKSCYSKEANSQFDLVGQRFGKWVVLKRVVSSKSSARYLCKCDCGREKEIFGYHLRGNKSRACPNCRIKTHGMSYTATFKIWSDMLARCLNPNLKAFKYYGDRGITVCERWLKFENFFADMGERPMGLQIDRIDVNGNYEPSNCRWTTPQINHSNRRCSKVRI